LPARRVLAAGGIATVLVAVGAVLVLGGSEATRAPTVASSSSPDDAPGGSGPAVPPLPASLRGTEVAGALPVDARGHLRVVPAVLELFDWFLAASGEEPIAQTRARIEAEIRVRLEPPAEGEALALLDRYLAYREAVRVLAESDASGLSLERRFQRVRELRRANFGGEQVTYRFEFPARLGKGNYSIALSLSRFDSHLDTNYEWRDFALVFHVINIRQPDFVGCAWLDSQVAIERTPPAATPPNTEGLRDHALPD
jgi:hypothetical protein